MANLLNHIEIKNFKSIKHIDTTCKRVNVFIGKPNVGKSNILEALGLLGAEYSISDEKKLSEFIRYEDISNLFYDDDLLNIIEVNTDKASAVMRYHNNNIDQADLFVGSIKLIKDILNVKSSIGDIQNEFIKAKKFNISTKKEFIDPYYTAIHSDGKAGLDSHLSANSNSNPIKKYLFSHTRIDNKFPHYLLPPAGNNLFTIVDHNKDLRKEISEIFSDYGLSFVASKKESKFEIQKNVDGYITRYNYSSIADTFQRLIFYYAAIDSNKNSVLILEEPEVHSFPPYTQELSNRIIDSKDNQFFITTHSPYLLQNLISNLDIEELNVFITYFEKYETKIKRLPAKI